MEQITFDLIKKIAKLSNIELTNDELLTYHKQMNELLSFFNIIQQVDVSNININDYITTKTKLVVRNDEINNFDEQELIIQQSPNSSNNYFCVPLIVDKTKDE